MSKSSSKKRIIIAASLFAIFLIGAIVSVVLVLAATTQNVKTNISIAYIVDGVGVKVNSSYAIVPIKEDETITRVSMTSDGNEDLNFGVSQEETLGEMQPGEKLSLDSAHQQIVFEYYFESTSDAAFSIELIDSPGKNSGTNTKEQTSNMLETYYVSKTRLNVLDYRDKITYEEFNPQALTEIGSKVYIYVSAKVKNENLNAYYNGIFTWQLNKQDTIEIMLNNGDLDEDGVDDKKAIKVISSSVVEKINMPTVSVPVKEGSAFKGYYLDGEKYIRLDGTGEHVANVSTSTELVAEWYEGMTIDKTTLLLATEKAVDDTGTLTIPDGITIVGDGIHAVNTTATTVIIPKSVSEIAENAFADNVNLLEVEIENSSGPVGYADGYTDNGSKLKVIRSSTFAGCINLTKMTIPASVTTIEKDAFKDCVSLSELYLEDIGAWLNLEFCLTIVDMGNGYVYKIPDNHPFGYYNKSTETKYYLNGELITDLVIPDTVTKIPSYSFIRCDTIKSITMADSVKIIEEYGFTVTKTLESIKFSNNLEEIGMGAFANSDALKSLEFPSTLKKIGELAFDCSGLESINIPASVEELGCAFTWCQSLRSVTFEEGSKITSLKEFTFNNCAALEEVYLPEGIEVLEDIFGDGCTALKTISIPRSLKVIKDGTFAECSNMQNIYISDIAAFLNIDFGEGAINHPFYYNYETKPVNIGETKIYLNGTLLETLVIPQSITRIETQAFSWCASLRSVKFHSGVEYVCKGAFTSQAVGLDAFYVDSIENWFNIVEDMVINGGEEQPFWSGSGKGLLYVNNQLLTEVIIPETVTEIPNYAFYCVGNITSVVIPSSVTSIGKHAFAGLLWGQNSLTSVEFENITDWFVADSADATSGTSVNLMVSYSAAATLLADTYASKYWKRSV